MSTEHSAEKDAHECERGDRLEAMCERLADTHVELQEVVEWALSESLAWRDKMPRTRENNTYPNGRQDGVDVVVRIVRAAVSAHLRGEDPRVTRPDPCADCGNRTLQCTCVIPPAEGQS